MFTSTRAVAFLALLSASAVTTTVNARRDHYISVTNHDSRGIFVAGSDRYTGFSTWAGMHSLH